MRKHKIAMTVLMLAMMACICGQCNCNGPTITPTPKTQPTQMPAPKTEQPGANNPVPNYNEAEVSGNRGTAEGGIPVLCGPDEVEGNVDIPPDSFSGTETVSIECVDPDSSDAQHLDELVRQKTGSTSEVLGAVTVNPSPFDFKKDIAMIIPLFRQRGDLAGQTMRVYFYAPSQPDELDYVDDATVSSDGWRAIATHVRHFSIFIVVYTPPEETYECPDPLGCAEIPPDNALQIGYLLPLSGAQAQIGVDSLHGVEIAIQDRAGEILGRPLELIGADTGCNFDGGEAGGKQMTAYRNLVGVIGTGCSSAALGALPHISESGLVMISPSNTNPGLTNPDQNWMPGYYRTIPNDIHQSYLAAEFAIQEQGLFRAAALSDGSSYTDSLSEAFLARFEELGGDIVGAATIAPGDPDRTAAILDQFVDEGAEVLYLPVFESDAYFILRYTKDITGEEMTFIMPDFLYSDDFMASKEALGTYMTAAYLNDPRYEEFVSTYTSMYGESPSTNFAAHAYDAANLLLEAIASVAVTTEDGTLYLGHQALRDALTATRNYAGVTGALSCTQYGDCASRKALAVFENTRGVLYVVYTP
jgi:branched-chain amino acid transport system substrate-binding protein